MQVIQEFDPVIYPYKLWVLIAKNTDSISELFYEYSGEPLKFAIDTTGIAYTTPVMEKETRKYGVLIFFKSKRDMTFETVAHEASHAAKYLFSHINASIDEHEPFEYVIGWIAKCCSQVKSKKTKIATNEQEKK